MKENILLKWTQASYTVEAAFVVPFILGIIFALLYFLFYEHDKAVFRGNLREAVICLAEENEDLPNDLAWRKQLQQHLWIGEVSSGSVSKTTMKIKGSGEVTMNLSIPVMEYFLDNQQRIQWSYTMDLWQPEKYIRQKDSMPEIGVEQSG